MSSTPLSPPSPFDVHVWRWDLDACSHDIEPYWQTLSAQERNRAGQFRFERHRRRFVAGRGEVRRILGRYLSLPPQAVEFAYGAEGKPHCASQPATWTLNFNLSHCENAAALAIANGIEIGIDIERVRPIEETMPLQIYSREELAQFNALPDAQRQAVFFETWARKEACLKAIGSGFMLPPDHFAFDLSIHGDTTPAAVGGDAHEAAHWRVRALPCGSAYAAAIAARRTGWSIVEMH